MKILQKQVIKQRRLLVVLTTFMLLLAFVELAAANCSSGNTTFTQTVSDCQFCTPPGRADRSGYAPGAVDDDSNSPMNVNNYFNDGTPVANSTDSCQHYKLNLYNN